MKLSGIFDRAKDLIYFLLKTAVCVPRSNFFVNMRDLKLYGQTRTRNGKDFLFKKREFEKLFDIFSPL